MCMVYIEYMYIVYIVYMYMVNIIERKSDRKSLRFIDRKIAIELEDKTCFPHRVRHGVT